MTGLQYCPKLQNSFVFSKVVSREMELRSKTWKRVTMICLECDGNIKQGNHCPVMIQGHYPANQSNFLNVQKIIDIVSMVNY